MKIRTKLTLNVAVSLAGIGIIAATSILTTSYIRTRVSYLTERSAPFQVRTLELGRAEEAAIASLLRVGSARTVEEATAAQTLAERGLQRVAAARQALQELSSQGESGARLEPVAAELFRVTRERLGAARSAADAGAALTKELGAAQSSLRSLEARVSGLQKQRADAFDVSMKANRRVLAKLQAVQALKASLKDLQAAFSELQKSDGKKAVLIARGKANSALSAAQENEAVRASAKLSGDLKSVAAKTDEWAKGKVAGGADTTAEGAAREAGERLSAVLLGVEEDLKTAAETYRTEAARQEAIFSAASSATEVLKGTAELVALGLRTEVLATAALHADSEKELQDLCGQIGAAGKELEAVGRRTEAALARLSAREQSQALQSVQATYRRLIQGLEAPDGALARTGQSLQMEARSKAALDRLGELVRKEAAAAERSVATARAEQDTAVAALHRVARGSFGVILAAVLAAMVAVAGFGVWIYRSVNAPLGELIAVSGAVAAGDLTAAVEADRSDEIGEVQRAMARMVGGLREIAGELKTATTSLGASSNELSATACSLEEGARAQSDQVSQSAAAVEEMAQTSGEVAANAAATSKEGQEVRAIAQREARIFEETNAAMEAVGTSVRESAERMGVLESRSRAITEIVDLIKDISDQTSLLALNAAIEASRAGEHGRGFAVVADNVRSLADRTARATEEIGTNLSAMKKDIEEASALMTRQRASITDVARQVGDAAISIQDLTGRVDQVGDMVDRIAVAAEQQSATSQGLAQNMESLDQVTRKVTTAFAEVEKASEGLLHLAGSLEGLTGRFRL